MTNAISQTQLDTSLQKVKAYVDNQANANVYQEETLLNNTWTTITAEGSPSARSVKYSGVWSSATTPYQTFWGSTAPNANQNVATLSGSMTDYDGIVIEMCLQQKNEGATVWTTVSHDYITYNTKNITDPRFANGAASELHTIFTYSPNVAIAVGAVSNTKLAFAWPVLKSETNSGIEYQIAAANVYGIKYVPKENYSTTEQIVGKWIDGSNVYMRTFTGNMPAVSRGQGGQINLGSGPKTILDWGGDFHIRNASGDAVVRSAGCDISFYGASSDGGPYSVWTSGLYIGQSGNLMAVFRSPEATKGDQATTSDTYNFWVKYTK